MWIALGILWNSLICILHSGTSGPPDELIISGFACQLNNPSPESGNSPLLDTLDYSNRRACNETISGKTITGERDEKIKEDHEETVFCKLINTEQLNEEQKESDNDLGSPMYLTNLHNKSFVYSEFNYSCGELDWLDDYLILNTVIICPTCPNTSFVDKRSCTLVISINKHKYKSSPGMKDKKMDESNSALPESNLLLKLCFLLGLFSILFFRELICYYQSRPTRIFDGRKFASLGQINVAIIRWLTIVTNPAEMKQSLDNIIEAYNYMYHVHQDPANHPKQRREVVSICNSTQNGNTPSKHVMKKSVNFAGENSTHNEDGRNEDGNCSDLEDTRIQQELRDRRQTDVFILQHSFIQPGSENSSRTARHRCGKSAKLPRPILKRRQ